MDHTTPFAQLFAERRNKDKTIPKLNKIAWAYPAAIEAIYSKSIANYLKAQWLPAMQQAIIMAVGARNDAAPVLGARDDPPSMTTLLQFGERANAHNMKQWDKYSKVAIGEAFDPSSNHVQSTISGWAAEQQQYISGASRDQVSKALAKVADKVRLGATEDEISGAVLAEMEGISARRARNIARDQMGKLNSKLSEMRMSDAGLKTYTWQTAHDERVRGNPGGRFPTAVPSHYLIDGAICRFDNGSVMFDKVSKAWVPRLASMPTGSPGMEILCRCVAVPRWEEMMDDDDLATTSEVPVQAVQVGVTKEVLPPEVPASPLSDKLRSWVSSAGGSEYETALSQAVSRAPEDLAHLYKTKLDNVRFVTLEAKEKGLGGAYYRVGDKIELYLGCRMTNPLGAGNTWIHEMGHALDHKLSEDSLPISFHKNLVAESKKDLDAFVKRIASEIPKTAGDMKYYDCFRKYGEGVANYLFEGEYARTVEGIKFIYMPKKVLPGKMPISVQRSYASRKLRDELAAARPLNAARGLPTDAGQAQLSDIFGASSKGEVEGGWGHEKSYWNDKWSGEENRNTEIFAEMSSLLMSDPLISEGIIKNYLPHTSKAFLDILKEARK